MDRVAGLATGPSVRPVPRVLFVTGEYPPRIGGIGDHVVRLAEGLRAHGLTCFVATESRSVDQPDAGIHAVAGQYPLQAVRRTLQIVRRVRPDVVHVHYQAGAFARPGELWLLAWLLKRTQRLVVTFHDILQPYLFPKAGRLRERVVRGLARSAHAAIYVDELDRRRAVAHGYGAANSKWIPAGPTIEPSADTGNRSAARERLGLDAKDFIIGFFGFRQASKGVVVLADALRRPELSGPRSLLALIGAASPTTDSRRSEPPVPASTFAGVRLVDTGEQPSDRISQWLIACDAIALPFLDGLSARRGSFMNAVAHGVPVVSTPPPSMGLVDVGADEAAFAPSGDAAALAVELAAIRDNRARRQQLVRGSRAIASRHTWSAIARRTLAAYADAG